MSIFPSLLLAESERWMSSLAGERLLSSVTLPGTHDAGATREPFRGTAKTQTASIAEQLNFGVRLFDIRCRHVQDAFVIHHGMVNQKLTFDEVVKQTYEFLDENPSETVVMSINQEFVPKDNTREFFQTLDAYFARQPERWYLKTTVPTLREARGKIILLRRFARREPQGINASQWPGRTFKKNGLVVQDCFQVREVEEKWKQITTAFSLAQKETNPAIIHLNFTSGRTITRFGLPDILAVSDAINPRLANYFQKQGKGFYGWIMMDFATPDLARRIYRKN